MNQNLAIILLALVKVLVLVLVLLTAVAYYTFGERKFSAWMQLRTGPNRCGPLGVLQPLADGVKFNMKEDVIPHHVDKVLYVLAPAMATIPAMITVAVVPFADPIRTSCAFLGSGSGILKFQIADLNIGILYIFAISSLAVYGVVMAGWASNNKYSMLGSLRASAQMISYELTLGLSIIGILMVFGSLSLTSIVNAQVGHISFLPFIPKWGIFVQPLGFVLFLVAAFAECNRPPFDFAEGEAEIVAGYHTEYGSMKFALFMMAEYSHMMVSSMVITCLFLGGWHIPYLDRFIFQLPQIWRVLIQLGIFGGKTFFFMFLFIWIRWTLPRLRYDKLMNIGWKVLLPLALLNVFATSVFYVFKPAILRLLNIH